MTNLKKISDRINVQSGPTGNSLIIGETRDIELVSTKSFAVNNDFLKENNIYIDSVNSKEDAIISAYKELRTRVMAKLDHLSARTLMITSPVKGNGKTTVALNLAINIARLGGRTALLVDMDLRCPNLHYVLGYTPEYGVVDVSRGKTTIEGALITPGVERLSILCGDKRYNNSSEIIASGGMQSLFSEIRNRYKERVIIFDAPPLLGCDDSTVLASMVDACLVVVEENKTTYSELDMAMEKLGDIHLAGYVLNKSKGKHFENYYY